MRPGKDKIFVDETGKEFKRIDRHVRRSDASRKRDAKQVENIFRGRVLSCRSLTLRARLFCMPDADSGGYGIGRVVMRNCSLIIFLTFDHLCVIHLFRC